MKNKHCLKPALIFFSVFISSPGISCLKNGLHGAAHTYPSHIKPVGRWWETHSLWYMQIMKNDTGSRSPRSHYWHPTSIYKSQTKPASNCSQTWLCRFSHLSRSHSDWGGGGGGWQYAHIHLDYLISLFFLWLKKGEEKNQTGIVSHAQREKMTPRSVIPERQSRMTLTFHFAEMPVDYSVSWRRRETDRRREEKQK